MCISFCDLCKKDNQICYHDCSGTYYLKHSKELTEYGIYYQSHSYRLFIFHHVKIRVWMYEVKHENMKPKVYHLIHGASIASISSLPHAVGQQRWVHQFVTKGQYHTAVDTCAASHWVINGETTHILDENKSQAGVEKYSKLKMASLMVGFR